MMRLGYFFADGRQDYGDHFAEQASYTNLYRSSLSGVEGRSDPVAFAARLSERAVAAGKSIWLALDMPRTEDEESLWLDHLGTQMEIINNAVVAIELCDEPNWTAKKAKRMARLVRQTLNGAWPNVPLGVTLASQDVLAGLGRRYSPENGYGYLAAEAYLETGTWEPAAALDQSCRLVKRLKRNTPSGLKFWVVGMSYDRNGAFGPGKALRAAQHGTYKGAVETGAEAICWFSYGRPGGVVTYPKLRQEHRAIARQEGIL